MPPLTDSTPCRPKGSPLCTILRYSFLVTDPKIFLKASSAPILTNFDGKAHAEKSDVLVKNSKQCLKTDTLAGFSEFCLRVFQNGLFSALSEIGKSIWLT